VLRCGVMVSSGPILSPSQTAKGHVRYNGRQAFVPSNNRVLSATKLEPKGGEVAEEDEGVLIICVCSPVARSLKDDGEWTVG
jgi:hypothetical protein